MKQQAPQLLNGGGQLREWLLAGGRSEVAPPFWRLRTWWYASWFDQFEHLARAQTAQIELPLDPVFIVGLWRTGSTFLHSRLHEAALVTTPLTWQCFRPATLHFHSAPTWRSVRRPMDSTVIATESPQEDEFAALLLGEPSMYRGFLDPRRLPELTTLLWDWRPPALRSAEPLGPSWETFLKGVLMGRPHRLLLKSPNHTFRTPWLSARFPRAQFVWIMREREAVLQSNRRMWAEMVRLYGFWQAPQETVDTFIEQALDAHDRVFEWARSNLADRLHVIPFDTLTAQTATVVAGLIRDLGLRHRAEPESSTPVREFPSTCRRS